MINVTRTFLPPFEEYTTILQRAWSKGWITNGGELVQELEQKLKDYLSIENLLFTNNGTVVLQMALKVLGITGEVITTPFSYVATTNAILWENCTPVFVDIDKNSLCIDPSKIEASITDKTQAILATHVYGFPCDVEAIEAIALKHNLKVIYDAAHAFGCTYKGKSLLSFGDISTCSFHATKIFHTVEGGCIVTDNKEINDQLYLYRCFGHIGDDYYSVGINGKNSEFHAAMGLAVLPSLPAIIKERKRLFHLYDNLLPESFVKFHSLFNDLEYNYCYYPIIMPDEQSVMTLREQLLQAGVNTRRYFYPSLNTLPQLPADKASCPVSEDISSRVLCLPLYPGLLDSEVEMISKVVLKNIE